MPFAAFPRCQFLVLLCISRLTRLFALADTVYDPTARGQRVVLFAYVSGVIFIVALGTVLLTARCVTRDSNSTYHPSCFA